MFYTGTLEISGVATVTVSSSVDLFKLIEVCSGWLCQATRTLRNRDRKLDYIIDHSVLGVQ